MKRKFLITLLAIMAVMACVFGLTACTNSSTSGTYYLYENGKLDKSQYIKLDGDKWSDDDNASGNFKLNGTDIVFYAEVLGSNEEMYSGTLSDGVLKVKVFGATMTYYKEGTEPSGNGGTEKPEEKPDDKPKTEYTVTFDANGGTFSDGKTTLTQKAQDSSTLSAPSSPTRTASAFGGWATDKGGKTLWKFATDTVTKNITLYAVWDEQSAAIISADGATIDENKMTVFMLVGRNTESVSLSNKIVCSSDSVWKLYYDKLGQTEIPTKIAAGKLGELSNGDNIFYIVVTSSNGSQVNVYELTIHRSYAVTVSYYDNKSNLIKTDTAYTGYEYEVNYTPNIDGYTFNYWRNGSGKVTSITTYEPVKLYADCTVKTYKATLYVNGGEAIEDKEQTVTYDKGFTFPVTERTGYTFAGWYVGDTQVTNSKGASLEKWNYTNDKNITAKWTANAYKVTLNKDLYAGGTVTGDGNHDYDSSVTIKAQTNDGYTWLGWYDKDGEKVTDKFTYTFKMAFATEYIAKWIKCPVTIESNDNSAGTISGMPNTTVTGQEVTVTAKTNIGYTWLGWYNGETELTKQLSYTFTIPLSSDNKVSYTARWTYYTLTTQSNNENAGWYTVKNNTKTTVGVEITLKAQEDIKYTWLGWYDGEIELTKELNYIFNMPAENITYTAKWESKGLDNFNVKLTDGKFTITGVIDKTVSEINVPSFVVGISLGAFSGCSKLESIAIPFVGGSIKSSSDTNQYPFGYIFGTQKFENSVSTEQHYYASSTTSATNSTYYLPSSLQSVTITGGDILYGAFYNCSALKSIIIPDSVTSIGESAFCNCSALKSIIIPDSVTSIGVSAFENCSEMTNIIIPDSVTTIGESAFCKCSELTSITIPDGVTTIGFYAFMYCRKLTIYCEAAEKPNGWNSGWNYSNYPTVWDCKNNEIASDGYIYAVINGIKYALNDKSAKVCQQTKTLNGNIEIPSTIHYKGVEYSVTSIGVSAFENCSEMTNIIIPDSVTTIGNYAFRYCSRLNSLTIPDSVTSISQHALLDIRQVTSIICPSFVASGMRGFMPNLKRVVITTGEIIEYNAFANCEYLESITIPASVTTIGASAFYNCKNLKSINFMGTRAQWEAIEKGSNWNNYTGNYTLHFTDDVDF